MKQYTQVPGGIVKVDITVYMSTHSPIADHVCALLPENVLVKSAEHINDMDVDYIPHLFTFK